MQHLYSNQAGFSHERLQAIKRVRLCTCVCLSNTHRLTIKTSDTNVDINVKMSLEWSAEQKKPVAYATQCVATSIYKYTIYPVSSQVNV